MRQIGLLATELGPEVFLPNEPAAIARVLIEHRLQPIGGFTPLLLHLPDHDPIPGVERTLDAYAASGATVLVLSADSGATGYDTRPELDDSGWLTLLSNLDRVAELARSQGVRAVLHPHVGTLIETSPEVQRVLDGTSVSLCLDTGHLLIGGTDPADLAPDRIAHLHLKDVGSRIAAQAQSGRLATARLSGKVCTGHWVPATSTFLQLSGTCERAVTTAGTRWSRTPFSLRSLCTAAGRRRRGQRRISPGAVASCRMTWQKRDIQEKLWSPSRRSVTPYS
jgi:Xylose isomerase-like TIM barrel